MAFDNCVENPSFSRCRKIALLGSNLNPEVHQKTSNYFALISSLTYYINSFIVSSAKILTSLGFFCSPSLFSISTSTHISTTSTALPHPKIHLPCLYYSVQLNIICILEIGLNITFLGIAFIPLN